MASEADWTLALLVGLLVGLPLGLCIGWVLWRGGAGTPYTPPSRRTDINNQHWEIYIDTKKWRVKGVRVHRRAEEG